MQKRYRVTMYIESGGEPEEDIEIHKVVRAEDKHVALDKARNLVRDENPELNHQKIWAWCIERTVVA